MDPLAVDLDRASGALIAAADRRARDRVLLDAALDLGAGAVEVWRPSRWGWVRGLSHGASIAGARALVRSDLRALGAASLAARGPTAVLIVDALPYDQNTRDGAVDLLEALLAIHAACEIADPPPAEGPDGPLPAAD